MAGKLDEDARWPERNRGNWRKRLVAFTVADPSAITGYV
jgi:hypothetical protein